MSRNPEDDGRTYAVVVNHEDQYSIWPDGSPIPAGWRAAGKTGSRAACLESIQEVWTDLRPRSLRQKADDSHEHGTTR